MKALLTLNDLVDMLGSILNIQSQVPQIKEILEKPCQCRDRWQKRSELQELCINCIDMSQKGLNVSGIIDMVNRWCTHWETKNGQSTRSTKEG